MRRFGLKLDEQATVTVTFLTLAFSQLWHVFNMRHQRSALIDDEVSRNPWIWAALALCGGILLTAAYVPSLAYMLHMVAPEIKMWGIISLDGTVPLFLGRSSGALFAGRNHQMVIGYKQRLNSNYLSRISP